MSAVLANAFSKFTAKSFFSITAASLILFVILNIRIEKVLNENNGKSMSTVQLVLEFQSPFWDDSPIHDSDADLISSSLDPLNATTAAAMTPNHNPKAPKSPNSKQQEMETKPAAGSKEAAIPSAPDSKAVVIKGEPGAPQETRREDFSYLFSTMPHNCVMEQDCHIFISDSPQFMEKTMVVIGMVRDSEKDIIATLQQLDEISCLFDQIVFIFYESNSKDNTPYVLEDWNVMYLDGSHCDLFRFNPNSNASTTSLVLWYY